MFLRLQCTLLEMKNRTEEQKKTTTQYLIRITVQIQVHAHNESQLPNILVSVTTLLQCSVVYIFIIFFLPQMNVRGRKNRGCLVLRANITGHQFPS